MSTRTLYVSRRLQNADEFITHFKAQGFETVQTPEQLHVTIAYSKTPLEWPAAIDDLVTVVTPEGREVTPLGDGGAVVLKFKSPTLESRWRDLCSLGASWDYDGYRPHVTVSWKADGVDLAKVQPYVGRLIFGPEVFKEIDEDWKAKHVEKITKAQVLKVDDGLGLVFGWAIVSKVAGVEYFDVQGDHIPEDAMLKASTNFMLSDRVSKEMHVGDGRGRVVFAFPMTDEIAKAMGITCRNSGLMIAMKPDTPDILEKFRNGTYTGFSIGGARIRDEELP